MTLSYLDLAVDLAHRFEAIGIRYAIGGSVASSLVGEPRSTVDIDIAVQLDETQLRHFIDNVRPTFYVPDKAALRAVRHRQAFNIIHTTAALKADLFVVGKGTLDKNQIARRMQIEVPTDPPAQLWITSTEDQILRKLAWYRDGGSVSDRQWRDIVAIIEINRTTLDDTYLRVTAEKVELDLLLRSALLASRT